MRKSKLKRIISNLESLHEEASNGLVEQIKENKDLKNELSLVNQQYLRVCEENKYLKGFKEGVKSAPKIEFSPTVNHAPKNEDRPTYKPGGIIYGAGHETFESKEDNWLRGRTLKSLSDSIKQHLSPEMQADIENLKKPDLKKLDEDFKQQPFNQDSKTPIHEENRCYFKICINVDLLSLLTSMEKREFFYFLKDDDRQIKILESLADLRKALNLRKTLYWRWEQ